MCAFAPECLNRRSASRFTAAELIIEKMCLLFYIRHLCEFGLDFVRV